MDQVFAPALQQLAPQQDPAAEESHVHSPVSGHGEEGGTVGAQACAKTTVQKKA